MGFTQFIRKYCKNSRLKQDNKFIFLGRSLILNITSRCNFSCKHCLRNSKGSLDDLSLEIIEKVLAAAKKYNFKHVSITGGEPFLYPKLDELMELITKNDYTFSIVTNGYNFKPFADSLKKQKKLALITFSLESIDKKQHDGQRREGSYEKLLEDFRICRAYKIPFAIVTVASSTNYDQMLDIALFAKKKGAKVFMGGSVIPCPRSQDNKLLLDQTKRQELFMDLRVLSKILKFPIILNADIQGANDIKICRPLNMTDVAIDTQGNLVFCCELDNIDDENIRRRAIITSLKDKTFDDALKILSEHLHKFICTRIEDYKTQPNPQSIDFNSCRYCLEKFSLP